MSTDRELLELAAKAFWGEEIDDVCSVRWLEEDQAIGYMHGENQDHNGTDQEFAWNPLIDDGDALRLAVKCRIDIEWRGDGRVSCYQHINDEGYCYPNSCESSREDVEANVRRAIVRAAAEIGRGMP